MGALLGGKKKLSFTLTDDFEILLFEDGVLMAEYEVTGLQERLATKWKDYNMTGPPKIAVSVTLEHSGIVDIKSPIATVEEAYWANASKEKPKKNSTRTSANNSTDPEVDDVDGANASEAEVVLKLKKKKHEKKLNITRKDFLPMTLSERGISSLKSRLEAVGKQEADVQAVAESKNELEAVIYGARDRLEADELIKVSKQEQRDDVIKLCTEFEEWLHEASVSRNDYEKRVEQLRDAMGPIEERALELEKRAELGEFVEEKAKLARQHLKQVAKDMSWVNKSTREALESELTEFESWWEKKQAQQKQLPLHEAPAFTTQEVKLNILKIVNAADQLRQIKKPKDKKKKDADGKAAGTDGKDKKTEGTKEESQASPLPATLLEAQKELEDVQAKKATAVEGEDFAGAKQLKEREKHLLAHIKAFNAQTEL